MKRRTLITAVAAIAATLAVACAAPQPAAAADNTKRLDELKANFKSRFAAIAKAKSAGQIGETMQGVLEAVDPASIPADAAALIAAENADRRELYAIIASQENTTPDVVAKQNALRNYKNASPGHFIKKPDGTWHKVTG